MQFKSFLLSNLLPLPLKLNKDETAIAIITDADSTDTTSYTTDSTGATDSAYATDISYTTDSTDSTC